jgi:hypothetical protein
MKTPHWIPFTLLCVLVFFLAACTQQTPPPPPFVEGTKMPFEPSNNRRITAEFYNTATAEVFAGQILQTEQAEATLSIQATATAEANALLSTATAEANALLSTATAATRMEEISAYQYFEPFDQNEINWREDVEENRYWAGTIAIQDGVYTWQVDVANEIFLAWSYFSPEEDLADFDVALKARRVAGPSTEACYGLLFRTSPEGYQNGTYVLSVCDEGYFKLLYYDSELGWEIIQNWTGSDAVRPDEWNLLEISAREDTFTISLNHQAAITFTDSRLASGSVAVLIDIYAQEPSQIEFDFFALQPR